MRDFQRPFRGLKCHNLHLDILKKNYRQNKMDIFFCNKSNLDIIGILRLIHVNGTKLFETALDNAQISNGTLGTPEIIFISTKKSSLFIKFFKNFYIVSKLSKAPV